MELTIDYSVSFEALKKRTTLKRSLPTKLREGYYLPQKS